MFVSEALNVNQEGHLSIGGCDCVSLAESYGTPVYVMDESLIRKRCRQYRNALKACYGDHGLILYASKAFCCRAMCEMAASEGLGLDVVSGGELYTAQLAGFPMDRVYFHGNNKTADEIRMALRLNIGRFVVDNREELVLLNRLAGEAGKTAEVSFRIKPGIDAHTHDFIMTGQIDSKFGFALENGEAAAIVKEAAGMPHIHIQGVHAHIGSQIFERTPFEKAAEVLLQFMNQVRQAFGITMTELNLGGGYGIKYIQEHDPLDYHVYIEAVSGVIRGVCDNLDFPVPFILMEPGRSIVASAGITLYTVGSVKEIRNIRTYASVDGGMTDNPRYALYGAAYEAILAAAPTAEKIRPVTIAGRCCESGDIIIKDIMMPALSAGDILAVMATGAYNYSMASHYNRVPNPPVVLVREGTAALIIRGETYEDLIRNDLPYPRSGSGRKD